MSADERDPAAPAPESGSLPVPDLEPDALDRAAAGEPRSFGKLLRRLFVAALVLLALVAFLPMLLSTGWTRDVIHEWLKANVDRRVEFGALDVSWTGGVTLTDLVVADRASPDTPLLEAPEIALDAPLFPLLARRIEVRKLRLTDPVVHLAFTDEGGLNSEGVVKRRKRRGGGRGRRGESEETPPEPAPGQEDEVLVLPEIDVPIEVRGLTLVFADRTGRLVRQSGITFDGRLTTRDVPATFDLHVPTGPGDGLRFQGTAALFDAEGALLPAAARRVDAEMTADRLRAADHADLLALFLPDVPLAGVVDGTFSVKTVGTEAEGNLKLRLLDVAVGSKSKDATASGREDLTLAGSFRSNDEGWSIQGFEAKAEGLDARADLSGSWRQLSGQGRVDADLEQLTRAVAALGFEIPGDLRGRIQGTVDFDKDAPGRGGGRMGVGKLVLSDFVADAPDDGREPVRVEQASLAFEVIPGRRAMLFRNVEARLPDLVAKADGKRAEDGSFELDAEIDGDLGALVRRVRDLGLLPAGFALNGTLSGKVHAEQAAGAKDFAVTTPGLRLVDDDVALTLTGGRAADGGLDVTVKGGGDLGRLLQRAESAGTGPAGIGEIGGRFDLDARAAGPLDAVAVNWNVRIDGPLDASLVGARAPDGALSGTAKVTGGLADLETLAQRVGALAQPLGLTGKLVLDAELAGTADDPVVPRMEVVVSDGPLTGKLTGALRAGRQVSAALDVGGKLDALLDLLRSSGHLDRNLQVGGNLRLTAVAQGPLDAIEFPRLNARLADGPLAFQADGSLDALGALRVDLRSDLPVAELARLQRQWAGKDAAAAPTELGKLVVEGVVTGKRDAPVVRLDRIALEHGTLVVTGSALLGAEGDLQLDMAGGGGVDRALELAHAFETGLEWSGTGRTDLKLALRRTGDTVTGSLRASGDLDLVRGETRLREPALALELPDIRFDAATGRLAPLGFVVRASEAKLDGTLTLEPEGRTDQDVPVPPVARIEANLAAGAPFAANYAAFLGDVTFTALGGKVDVRAPYGDDVEGLELWTGPVALTATGVKAPYVTANDLKLDGTLGGGAFELTRLTGAVNQGTVDASGRFGLAGEHPPHEVTFQAKDVRIDGEVAPLLARVSPLLAVGEGGTAGGRFSAQGRLTSEGSKAQRIKRKLTGKGTLTLVDVAVESTNWVGRALEFVGVGGRLDLPRSEVPWTVENGKVTTGKLPFATSSLDLRLGGSVTLEGDLDYAFGIKPKSSNTTFDRLKDLLDADGFLPLRLEGDLASPKVDFPDVKDVVKSKLGDLLDRLKGKDEKDEDDGKDDAKKKTKKKNKKKKDGDAASGDGEDPPPPPPPPAEPPKDVPPPPPPAKDEPSDVPPPPPGR